MFNYIYCDKCFFYYDYNHDYSAYKMLITIAITANTFFSITITIFFSKYDYHAVYNWID